MASTEGNVRFWDRAARKYAAAPIKDMGGYNKTLARLRALLKPTDHVLEIGCGTGTTALALADCAAHITATDASGAMIAIAQEKAAAQGCGNVAFSVASLAGPSAPDERFDAVLALNVLHLLPALQQDLLAIRQLLKPGGLFISKTACLSEMNVLIRLAVPLMKRIGKAPDVLFFDGSGLQQMIAAAGFEVLETARHGTQRSDPRIFILARRPG